MRNFLRKIFILPIRGVAAAVFLTALLMLLLFGFGLDERLGLLALPCYLFSAYSLAVLILSLRPIVDRLILLLRRIPLIDRLFADRAFRTTFFFAVSAVLNLLYIVFYFWMGLRNRAIWFFAIAGYHLVLLCFRIPLVERQASKLSGRSGERLSEEAEWRLYGRYGFLLFVLNLAITGITVQMVLENRSYTYEFLMIFAIAAYAFYSLTIAIVNYFRFRGREDATLFVMRTINLAVATESMYALQTSMIALFGAEGEGEFRRVMNLLGGAAVFLVLLALSIVMIVRSRRNIRKEMEMDERRKIW